MQKRTLGLQTNLNQIRFQPDFGLGHFVQAISRFEQLLNHTHTLPLCQKSRKRFEGGNQVHGHTQAFEIGTGQMSQSEVAQELQEFLNNLERIVALFKQGLQMPQQGFDLALKQGLGQREQGLLVNQPQHLINQGIGQGLTRCRHGMDLIEQAQGITPAACGFAGNCLQSLG